jgi:hypothetical protein
MWLIVLVLSVQVWVCSFFSVIALSVLKTDICENESVMSLYKVPGLAGFGEDSCPAVEQGQAALEVDRLVHAPAGRLSGTGCTEAGEASSCSC